MNVYTNVTFTGFYPMGTATVVIAETPAAAAHALNSALVDQGLAPHVTAEDMELLPLAPGVRILCDGNY